MGSEKSRLARLSCARTLRSTELGECKVTGEQMAKIARSLTLSFGPLVLAVIVLSCATAPTLGQTPGQVNITGDLEERALQQLEADAKAFEDDPSAIQFDEEKSKRFFEWVRLRDAAVAAHLRQQEPAAAVALRTTLRLARVRALLDYEDAHALLESVLMTTS